MELRLGDDGWLVFTQAASSCRRAPSPHCDARPLDANIDLLVVHHISLPAGEFGGPAIEQFFLGSLDCDSDPRLQSLKGVRVSAHFLIRRDGSLIQFVSVNDRAWHAGVSSFMGRERCNDFSVGVEMEGSEEVGFEPMQIKRLADLCGCLEAGLGGLCWIAGHSDIAPGRKTDPGPLFDWDELLKRLSAQGSRLRNPFIEKN